MKGLRLAAGVVLLVYLIGMSAFAAAQESTIAGTVNSDFEIVTENGEKYYIEEGAVGDELAMQVGKKVLATGRVLEAEAEKSISVIEYRFVDEPTAQPAKEPAKNSNETKQ